MTDIRIAAAQYPIELLPSYDAWEAKLSRWVSEAVEQGAQLLVFPEYAAMELTGSDPEAAADLQASLDHVMALGEAVDKYHRQLAIHYEVTILGGSCPCRDDRGLIVNRARLFCPDGSSGHQDKIVMIRFEREIWGIAGGDAISVIDTPVGRVGISICYDAEFPLIARAQAEAGVRIILVPSATDSMQGYWRVRWKVNAMWFRRRRSGKPRGCRRWTTIMARRRFTDRPTASRQTMAFSRWER